MNSFNLIKEIEIGLPKLFDLARQMTVNSISNNCLFILSEIKTDYQNIFEEIKARNKENKYKQAVFLSELEPNLNEIIEDLYDLNIYIYKAEKDKTIIELRYFLKSNLDQNFRSLIQDNLPMIHFKVENPPSINYKKEKFDINWQHFV
jgi:hypothetical protein